MSICYVLFILSALNNNAFSVRKLSFSVVHKCTFRHMGMHLGDCTELHRLKKLGLSNAAMELVSVHRMPC